MNKPLRHVWLVVSVLFLMLFGSTTYFQVVQQKSLNADGRNARTIMNEFGRHRGPIVVDGDPIAQSTKSDDSYGYQRSYDPGAMYAPVTGYYSVVYGTSGLERSMDETLSGKSDDLFFQRIGDTLSGRSPQGATVELTLDGSAQKAAWNAMQGRKGAAVALDPETGKILAMVSTPSFDPNDLASHSRDTATGAWKQLGDDDSRPLTNRAIGGDLYPPGSTFKLVVAAAALEHGDYTKDTKIPGPGSYTLPNSSSVMANHPRGVKKPCGPNDESTLSQALQQSCNTSFAELGVKLGEDDLNSTAQDFGFDQSVQIPQSVTPSRMAEGMDDAQLASSSIGQYDTRVTPLQMAMVSASFANDGRVMQPQLVDSVRTSDLSVVDQFKAKQLSQPVSASNAAQMREMMVATVKDGTGTGAAIDGAEVGGKTGTAQWGDGRSPHAWFTGYGQKDGKKVAVAVVVEQGGYGAEAAAPVARDVMKAVIGG
jgi:peptidoglycan glycosyltransferase